MLYLVYSLYNHISDERSFEGNKTSVIQVQVNYQTKELYRAAIILKYRKYILIIFLFYCYIYSRLSDTTEVVQNSMELMRNKGFGP